MDLLLRVGWTKWPPEVPLKLHNFVIQQFYDMKQSDLSIWTAEVSAISSSLRKLKFSATVSSHEEASTLSPIITYMSRTILHINSVSDCKMNQIKHFFPLVVTLLCGKIRYMETFHWKIHELSRWLYCQYILHGVEDGKNVPRFHLSHLICNWFLYF